MKETTKMSRAVSQLEHIYNSLNTDFFNGELPVPIITVQSKPGTFGHCTTAKVWQRKDGGAYELNIAAEVLNYPIEETLDTMLHEMVHLYCRENNIKEVSRGGKYHNKKFKDIAKAHGLTCVPCGQYGWNTTPGENLIEYALSKKGLALEGLQRLLWYIQVYETRFAQEQMEQFGLQERKALAEKRRELDKSKQRVAEIDRVIQKSYEDLSKGLLTEERFATLTVSLESEQWQLKADIPELEASLNATADKAGDLQKFIQRARQVTRLTELTPEIVHEFIDKIVVSKPEKIDGKRHQRVDIHYNTIGLWCAPSPEEMEKLFQQHLTDKRKKTA